MKTRRISRLLLLIGLIALAAFLMGGGTDCPKPCVIADSSCSVKCGDPPIGTCIDQGQGLFCWGGDDEEEEPED